MTTKTYTNEMPYHFDPAHKGAPYYFEGAYKNNGEFCESVVKFHMGLAHAVNPATSYDMGSDIPELNASVKSGGASLACVYGESMEAIMAEYFANVHSTLWIYVVMIDDSVIEYHMEAKEFKNFLNAFGYMTKESSKDAYKIRIKKTSGKMLKWLDAQA